MDGQGLGETAATAFLGDIDVSGEDAPDSADEYADWWYDEDFEARVVALAADYHATSVAEQRGRQVARAMRSALSGSAGGCYPWCAASVVGDVPVFEYDKLVVLDTEADLGVFRRLTEGVAGFAAVTLKKEVASLAGGSADAWRPLKPAVSAPGSVETRLRAAVDPAARHCSLPGAACGSIATEGGVWTRMSRGGVETVRLLPGDRVSLVSMDGAGTSLSEYSPDARRVAVALGVRTQGDADRAAQAAGMTRDGAFWEGLRRAASVTEPEAARKAVPVELGASPRPGAPVVPVPVVPELDVARVAASVSEALGSVRRRLGSSKSGRRSLPATEGPGSVVKVYATSEELAADESDPLALYGPEFDDTPRRLLAEASSLAGDGPIEDKIAEASSTRLSAEEIKNVARGGRAIGVGQKVLLREGGVEHEYMRAADGASGQLFWALQTSRPSGSLGSATRCEAGGSAGGAFCFEPPPAAAEVERFREEVLADSESRLRSAAQKSDSSGFEGDVTRLRVYGGADGPYDRPVSSYRAPVPYVSEPENRYVAEFRAMRGDGGVSVSSGKGLSSYKEVAAAALLSQIATSVRLPPGLGARWLVDVVVAFSSGRSGESGDSAGSGGELGGGREFGDASRLRFLVAAALACCALSVLLGDDDRDKAAHRARRADVSGLLSSDRADAAWKRAAEDKITGRAVEEAASAILAASPMLEHAVELVAAARSDTAAEAAPGPKASQLDDWDGYRPRSKFMKPVEPVHSSDRRPSSVGTCCPSAVGPPGDAAKVRAPRFAPPGPESTSRASEAMRLGGLPAKHADRREIEGALRGGDPESAAAVLSSVVSLGALLSRLAHNARGRDDVRQLGSVTQEAARVALADVAPAVAAAKRSGGMKEAAEAWALAAEKLPPALVAWLARTTAEGLAVAAMDVDKLHERMEQAKESIKNEKIAFAEALDDDEASVYGEMRKLGIQTINDQILEYDRRFESEAPDEPAGEPESGYDVLQDEDDDRE